MGPGAHVLTFLVQQGQFLNIVAFKTNADDWPDYQRLTRPAKREDALRDFNEFGPTVRELLKLAKADLDCVCGVLPLVATAMDGETDFFSSGLYLTSTTILCLQ